MSASATVTKLRRCAVDGGWKCCDRSSRVRRISHGKHGLCDLKMVFLLLLLLECAKKGGCPRGGRPSVYTQANLFFRKCFIAPIYRPDVAPKSKMSPAESSMSQNQSYADDWKAAFVTAIFCGSGHFPRRQKLRTHVY